MSVFGKNVKKIRVLKNLSQQEFGDLFEVSRGSVGSYEEGRAEPKIDTAIKIAKHYKLSLDLLLTKEMTVNDISNFANNISNHAGLLEDRAQNQVPNNSNSKFIEERVADLEQKLKEIESRLNTENDN